MIALTPAVAAMWLAEEEYYLFEAAALLLGFEPADGSRPADTEPSIELLAERIRRRFNKSGMHFIFNRSQSAALPWEPDDPISRPPSDAVISRSQLETFANESGLREVFRIANVPAGRPKEIPDKAINYARDRVAHGATKKAAGLEAVEKFKLDITHAATITDYLKPSRQR